MDPVFQMQERVGFRVLCRADLDAAGLFYGLLYAYRVDQGILAVRYGLLQQFYGFARIGFVLLVAS